MTEKKLFIKTFLNNKLIMDEKREGFLENNILSYTTENDTFSIDFNKKEMIKKNLESTFLINNNKCTLTLNELNNSVLIPIKHYKLEINNNLCTIIYRLESQEEDLKIEIRMGDENNG